MTGDVDPSRTAALIGDPARARMLVALTGGRELSASLLAAEAGISRSTASEHLARLLAGGLVAVRADGRHRHYRLAGARVAELLERLIELSPPAPITSLRGATRAAQLRRARTCYDHLAGRLGVGIMAGLLARGHLVGGDGTSDPDRPGLDRPAGPGYDVDYRLTGDGERFLARLGVVVPGGRRALLRYCLDWTETRHHLAGLLGSGLRERFLDAGWVRPIEGHRALRVTASGELVLRTEFGLVLAEASGQPAVAVAPKPVSSSTSARSGER